MRLFWLILWVCLLGYFFALWARFVLDVVRTVYRPWRPGRGAAVVCEFVYMFTDPPIRLLRRVLPVLSIGQLRFDLSWSIVTAGVFLVMSLVGGLVT